MAAADNEKELPKLRLIDAKPIVYEGEHMLYLRDPLDLAEKNLLVPEVFVPVLAMCDGTRDPAKIRTALGLRYGLFLPVERIAELIAALDDALLLDNERSRRAMQEAREAFRQAEFREPASAGVSYPETADELKALLQGYLAESKNGSEPINGLNGSVRGVVSPHIDYERGGKIYANVWSAAAHAAQQAELVVIFGTDHFSEGYPLTLTRQNYATPYGVLPTDKEIVDQLAAVIGPEAAFAGELHHRREHSIELAATWLHHVRDGKPVKMVPVLTGSLDGQLDEATVEALLDVLRRAGEGRKMLVVAAGDMAHVGPAFGGEAVDAGKLIVLKSADDELIEAMCRGDAEGFYQAIRRVEDANNVCGVSPIYLTLKLLAPLHGQNFGYAVCPADQELTSYVSICGITLE